MHLNGPLEFGECLLLKEEGPLHSQVGGVELQQQALGVDVFVLLLHLLSHGQHIRLVRVVIGVQHGGGNDAGRSRGHEAFGEHCLLRTA